MQPDQINELRVNVLDAPASIVASQHSDVLALCEYVKELSTQAAALKAQPKDIQWRIVNGIAQGVAAAPPGHVVYHERLQLLQVFDAIDKLTDAIAAVSQPAPPDEEVEA